MDTNLPVKKISIINNKMFQCVFLLFMVITVWWFFVSPLDPNAAVNEKNIWSSSYEIISLLGGIFGVLIARYWGGYKSVLGRATLAFSVGLFLQTFGQIVYNYYTLVMKIQAPYPSLGDVGYFGSVIAYIYGAILLGHATGLKLSLKSIKNQLVGILLPLIMLIFSYAIFLSSYQFTGNFLMTFLDFGYPLGQAFYVSVALLVLYTSRKFLGGIMKKPILLLLIALFVQYVCDFDFLYKANNNTWYAGGPGDYLYVVSYLLMTVALISVGQVQQKLKAEN